MKKIALMIMILTIISKIFGFFREITLSFFYGATNVSDAYIIAVTIPGIFFVFLGAAIRAGYIPIYTHIRQEQGDEHARMFTTNVLNIVFLVMSVFLVITLVFTRQILLLLASGFDEETMSLAITFTRITIFSVYATAIVSVFKGFLNIRNNFWAPAVIGIPMNIIIITGIALSSQLNVLLMAYGYLIGMIVQALVLLPFIVKNKFRYHLHLNFSDDNLRRFMLIVAPIFLSVVAGDINKIVNRAFASNILVGGISALNYADRLNSFVLGVFTLAITTASLPMISKMTAEKNNKKFKGILTESVNLSIIIVLPITIGAMLFSKEIVSLLFGRGAFDDTAVIITASALFFYSIGLLPRGLKQIFSRAFFAMNDTKTPVRWSIVGVIINISLNAIVFFFTDFGISGLAAATSVSAFFVTTLLVFSLHNRIGRLGLKKTLKVFIKVTFAAITMGLVTRLGYHFVLMYIDFTKQLLSIGPFALRAGDFLTVAAILVGIGIYGVILYFMKIEDVDIMVAAIKKRFFNGKNKKNMI